MKSGMAQNIPESPSEASKMAKNQAAARRK